MEIIITICIISIILPIIFKTTDTNVKDDEEIASYGSGRDFDYLDEDDY